MDGKNKFGGGANTTVNGKKFEDKHSLEQALLESGFSIEDGQVSLDGHYVGLIMSKDSFYKDFLKEKMKDVSE